MTAENLGWFYYTSTFRKENCKKRAKPTLVCCEGALRRTRV